MRRSHHILRDETGAPRPPVYLRGYALRRRRGSGAGRWWAAAAVLLLALAAAYSRLG